DRRVLARLWNGCVGKIEDWPTVRLFEPPVKTAAGPWFEDFHKGLRDDIETHLNELARIHHNRDGQRARPCKPTTLTTRKLELVGAVRMAVKEGIRLEELTSLIALIHPDVADKILDGYWRKDGENPSTYTINLSSRFLGLGYKAGLDQEELRRLGDLCF